jgi:hypothetical protein
MKVDASAAVMVAGEDWILDLSFLTFLIALERNCSILFGPLNPLDFQFSLGGTAGGIQNRERTSTINS